MSGAGPESAALHPEHSRPDAHQIRDAVWLAAMIRDGGGPPVEAPEPERHSAAGSGRASTPEAGIGSATTSYEPPPINRDPPADVAEGLVRHPTEIPGFPLGALPSGRRIARALNPFKRRVRSVTEAELDEDATAEWAADTGIWLPRYRPAQERWLGLTLIVDSSATMAVWRPTLTALRFMLERHSAFRAVRTFSLSADDGGAPRLHAPSGGAHSPAELLDPSGRQAFLVITDGLGALWRHPSLDALLRLWGSCGPLTLVNPFPQRHWRDGNLVPRLCRLRSPRPAASTGELLVRYPGELTNLFDPPVPAGSLAVPLIELSPRWLRWWTRLLTGRPAWADATVHVVDPGTPPEPVDLGDEPEPEAAVLGFRRTSPGAFRLATLLAAAPLELPLLHRLQRILLPGSETHHLAEVLNSPLVRPAERAGFEFHDGVREALLACASRDDSARVLRTIAVHRPGRDVAGTRLAQVVEAPDSAPEPRVTDETVALYRIELVVLDAMSGPYAPRARRLRAAIDAYDRQTGTPAEDPTAEDRAPRTDVAEGGDPVPAQPEPERPRGVPDEPPFPMHDEFGLTSSLLPDERPLSLQEIVEGQSPDQAPEVWGNVPPRNPVFTGRRALLEQLETRLRTQNVAAVLPQALHGEGGVGKSQIAIEYAYRHRNEYDVIWWVPSERPAQILASLIELGDRLDLEVGNEVISAVPKVRDALRAGTPYGNWLLVFDNAENPETVRGYFPEEGTGKVLITSRNQEWSVIAESLEVDVFTRAESVRLLQRRNPGLPQPEADRLAGALGDLPLAIEHASAWLHATDMAVGDYLDLIREKQSQLTDLDLAPGYEIPVAAAANVALDRLAVENPAALQLLQVCSFFAPEPISRDLFEGVRAAMGAPELDEALKNPSRLNQAIRDIQKYVLARVDHRGNSLQLHRLVQKVLQDSIPAERRALMEHGAHLLLTGVKLGDPADSEQWLRYQALASHLINSRSWACEDDWARDVVSSLVKFYFYWGDYGTGRDLAQEVLEDWRTRLGTDHRQTLSTAKLLGYYWWVLGEFESAADIQRETLQLYQSTAGAEDEDTIDAMGMVASTLRVSGRFTAARDLDLRAFRTARQSLGEDDPATLRAAHNLSVSLRLTGEFRVARQLDADTYRRRIAALGHDHPETLRTLNNLTIDERECGEYIRSRRMVEENYNRYARLFGVAHQETIRIARNLAVARRRAGDHEGAYKLAEDTMNRFRERFGPTQPDTIAAALNFAVDLRESDDLPRARELAEQTAADYRETLGADHPYTLYARTNLAIVLRLLGRTTESEEHNRAAWNGLQRMLGDRHILTLTCGINLASDLAEQGRHDEAYELDAAILGLCRELIGREHPSTLACALNVSFDLKALGRAIEGAALFDETVDAYARVLGADHAAIIAARAGARANCDVDPMQF
ncbi:FxSxx-COOH system tetratricopeptide repeat protein [Actinoplanes sp. Pm04-4]|uniref:FxSxx-COOH system tetratricopeptide repeat protein n=1 Tax=Paractinoplanes pyxinae TaxID=2997416 RepID=A0ABT4AV70_9ACTN|nr:FxSxx-COOH system tetratricopeptide repeat protein [Actinoplanes pyxinae]MCY1138144.1 FxSxx-COOH system tetratricopeptide repeat protein [Actinoplanes pyxinae]